MSDQDSVERARASVVSAFNRRLKSTYNTRLNIQGQGDKEKARNPPPIDPATGGWTQDEHKPPAWLVAFDIEESRVIIGPTEGRRPNRLVGTYNCKSRTLQGVLARVLPVLRETVNGRQSAYDRHPYWEWALGFVFPGPATFIDAGSAAATLDFDPTTGSLSSTVKGRRFEQPYVSAALFRLVSPYDLWSPGSPLTYDIATDLLAQYVHVNTDQSVANVTDVEVDETEPEIEDDADTEVLE